MSKDLSTIHGPTADLFPRLEGAEDWRRYALRGGQVEHYRKQGYVAGVRILDENQVEALRAELEEFFDPGHDGRGLWYQYRENASYEPGASLLHASGAF